MEPSVQVVVGALNGEMGLEAFDPDLAGASAGEEDCDSFRNGFGREDRYYGSFRLSVKVMIPIWMESPMKFP